MSELSISKPQMLSEDEQKILDKYMGRVQAAEDGDEEAKGVYADLYVLVKSLEELQDQVKDQAIDELDKYQRDDVVERNGFEMKLVRRNYYSYKHDEAWQNLSESRKQRQKQMQKAFKMSEKGQQMTDMQTGEVIPPAEVSTSTYIKMEG